jgi:hypothetical protein
VGPGSYDVSCTDIAKQTKKGIYIDKARRKSICDVEKHKLQIPPPGEYRVHSDFGFFENMKYKKLEAAKNSTQTLPDIIKTPS